MLADKEKTLRSHPEFLARQNVVDAIKAGDMDMSKWYLERKVPEEFLKPQKVDTTISQNNAPLSVEERQQAISEYLQSLLPADAYTDSSDEE